jgi:predicted phage terminase large subunit-like protein
MSYDNRVFVTDMARSQWSTDDVDANILTTAKIDGHQVPIHIPEDPGSAGKKSSSAFVRMLVGFDVTTERMSGSKPTRAKPFSSQLNAGNVWFVRAWWNSAAKEELRTFPNGKHDDIVDSLADGFNVVADVFEPIGAPPSATCGPSPTTHGNRPVTAVPSEDGNFIVRAPMRTRRLR